VKEEEMGRREDEKKEGVRRESAVKVEKKNPRIFLRMQTRTAPQMRNGAWA